jgi:methyl coenzyme M reductase subunit C
LEAKSLKCELTATLGGEYQNAMRYSTAELKTNIWTRALSPSRQSISSPVMERGWDSETSSFSSTVMLLIVHVNFSYKSDTADVS